MQAGNHLECLSLVLCCTEILVEAKCAHKVMAHSSQLACIRGRRADGNVAINLTRIGRHNLGAEPLGNLDCHIGLSYARRPGYHYQPFHILALEFHIVFSQQGNGVVRHFRLAQPGVAGIVLPVFESKSRLDGERMVHERPVEVFGGAGI